MSDLPRQTELKILQIELKILRDRLREAIRAYEREPSESNIRRVDAARSHWRMVRNWFVWSSRRLVLGPKQP